MDQAVNQNPVRELLRRREQGREKGIYACCSANEYVIRAAIRRARDRDTVVLVEATANQVNQDGGYTGMKPADFRAFLNRLAAVEGMPQARVFCGGDHLGPLTWRNLPEAEAMPRALELVRGYVLAGFSKIHIDTSMRLADDDPSARLRPSPAGARSYARRRRTLSRCSAPPIPAPPPRSTSSGARFPSPGAPWKTRRPSP